MALSLMSNARPVALAAFVCVLGACTTLPPHQSRVMPENVALKNTLVVSVVPSNELSVRRDFVEGNSGIPAFICPVCGLAMALADKSAQEKLQAQDDAVLLPTLLTQLGDWRTRSLWEEGLRKTVKNAKDIEVAQVEVIDHLTAPDELQITPKDRQHRPFAVLELDHHLSANLDKYRMKVRARLFDEQGNSISEQHYFFLPVPVPGTTKSEAIGDWKANAGNAYRHTAELGVTGMLDALQLTMFSAKSGGNRDADASALLARRNCFAGDYEAGIPLDAYNKGTLLASRKDYSVVRLANNDVLVIAACDR